MPAAPEHLADRIDGGDVARIVGGDEAEVGEQQQARIECVAVERGDEIAVLVHRAREHFLAHARRAAGPDVAPVGEAEMLRDAR